MHWSKDPEMRKVVSLKIGRKLKGKHNSPKTEFKKGHKDDYYYTNKWRNNISKSLKNHFKDPQYRLERSKRLKRYYKTHVHPCKGRKATLIERERKSESKLSSKNPRWKGDEVKYGALHDWIKRRYPKPKLCEKCKKQSKYMDLANKGIYNRDLKNWMWICRKCHLISDGRIYNLKLAHKNRGFGR